MTGLTHARGNLVFLIDSDLEEDPELLATFAETLRKTRADVVYGVQGDRRGGRFERWSGWLFFKIFNLLSDYPIPENLTTVRLMTSRYVAALVAHGERETTIAGLWTVTGFAQVPIHVTKHERSHTTYSFGRKVALLVNSITSFSSRPLVLIFYLGAGDWQPGLGRGGLPRDRAGSSSASCSAGWPSLIVSVWLLGGLILGCLGIIGIYLSKIFIETKQRPYTIVRDIHERRPESAGRNDSRDRR